MDKKRICLIKWDMCEKSGADRVAALLADGLADTYDTHLVSICGAGEAPFFPVGEKVHYKALLAGHDSISHNLIPGCRRLRRYVKENRIDVLLSIAGNVNLFLWYGAKGNHCRKIFCEHYNLGAVLKDRTDTFLRKIGTKTADKTVVLNHRAKADYLRHFPLSEDKIAVIPNWISPELLGSPTVYNPESRRIVTAGRFTSQKGFDFLIDTAALFFPTHPDWVWDVYGEGPDWESIKALAEQKGVADKLHFLGNQPDLYSRYPDYAMYVMTSRHEALPMVLLEAKSCRLPLVSFDCPTGPSEIIRDGVDGLLAKPEDCADLAEKISRLADDPEMRRLFSENALGNINLFDKKTVIDRWIALIDGLFVR